MLRRLNGANGSASFAVVAYWWSSPRKVKTNESRSSEYEEGGKNCPMQLHVEEWKVILGVDINILHLGAVLLLGSPYNCGELQSVTAY